MNEPRRYPCPCCGHATLPELGHYDICPVCLWEDDGQDDPDADRDSGPNHLSLAQARIHYLTFGACDEKARSLVRPPAPDEAATRRFVLEGGRAVERASLAPETVWNLLHDGHVCALERRADGVRATVSCLYLRERLQPPGEHFLLDLLGCDRIEYQPYGGEALTELGAIATAGPDLVSAESGPEGITVWGSEGTLRLRYEALRLALDDGSPLSLDELDAQARGYWTEFARRRPRS